MAPVAAPPPAHCFGDQQRALGPRPRAAWLCTVLLFLSLLMFQHRRTALGCPAVHLQNAKGAAAPQDGGPPAAAAAAPAPAAAAADAAAPAAPIVVPDWPAGGGNGSFPDIAARVLAAERAGRGRKIISMALYGSNPRYTMGAVENALLAARDWQGWTLRLYVGDGVPPHVVAAVQALGAEVVRVTTNQRGSAGMFWRFYVVEDRTVSRFIVRDADARLTARDRAAVAEWEQSGRYFHTIHDHFNHIRPAMGGMWGAVGGFVSPQAIREWRAADGAARAAHPKKSDQFWLQDKVWPAAKAHALDHSSWHCNRHGAAEGRGLPTKRDGPRDFVGNVHDAGNGYRGMSLAAECPLECRRKPEWKFC